MKISKEQIEEAIRLAGSLAGAALMLGISRRTCKKKIDEFGLSTPPRGRNGPPFLLQDILNGKHPQYQGTKLSKRLVEEGIKQYQCESCGITKHNGKSITLELNHIDGNSGNHHLENLELLCPNCHSQTETYRSKKLTFMKRKMACVAHNKS